LQGHNPATKRTCRLFTGGLFTAAIHSVGVACERHRLSLEGTTGEESPVARNETPVGTVCVNQWTGAREDRRTLTVISQVNAASNYSKYIRQ